jgi:hypothetical protein
MPHQGRTSANSGATTPYPADSLASVGRLGANPGSSVHRTQPAAPLRGYAVAKRNNRPFGDT